MNLYSSYIIASGSIYRAREVMPSNPLRALHMLLEAAKEIFDIALCAELHGMKWSTIESMEKKAVSIVIECLQIQVYAIEEGSPL